MKDIFRFIEDSVVMVMLDVLAGLFILGLGGLLLTVVIFYVIDRTQTQHAIRRNYPVIGRFRYLFESLGEYFRQYFFAMDREELPFNRAQRAWVYRAAKGVDTTVAFGSTRELRTQGTISFINCPFPTLDSDGTALNPVRIGPWCAHPFDAKSFFNVSGMSYGALSLPAITALSMGSSATGCWLNTGEGGLAPAHLAGGGDIVFQIGTAKYGVRTLQGNLSDRKLMEIAQNPCVRMFEIKLSQGAKPGKGGILPGEKISPEIAAIRKIPQGIDSVSPNRHPEIREISDLLDMVSHIRTVTGKPTGFKLVLGDACWLEDLFSLVRERPLEEAPDFITIDSADGGTGAAPQPLFDFMGMPIWESLPLLANARKKYGFCDRIRIIASGKLINPGDVAWALATGADFIVTGRGFMFALGCIQALQCNKNTCPTGITTHNKRLQRGLHVRDKSRRVARYHDRVITEVRMIAHACGVGEPRLLRRHHARIVGPDGITLRLDEYYQRWSQGEIAAVDARPSCKAQTIVTPSLNHT